MLVLLCYISMSYSVNHIYYERKKERKETGMDKWQISFKTEQQNHYLKFEEVKAN